MAAISDTVAWDQLVHAYGPASDIPLLLKRVAAARGRKLFKALDELSSRVLHQGTIYSASPPVVGAIIEMAQAAKPREKVMFYGLLSGFAEAARQAIADGRAIPCCAGGDPVDGAAIRQDILNARQWLVADLAHPDTDVRSLAAELLTAFAETDLATARLIRDRYFKEDDPQARQALLDGLIRMRASVDDWPGFLNAALAREDHPASRFSLRQAQVCGMRSAAEASAVEELAATFTDPADEERFFEAVHLLGSEREQGAILRAFEFATDEDLVRVLAERLLRLVFEDRRTGWGQTSQSRLNEDGSKPPGPNLGKLLVRSLGMLVLLKLFPFILRRKIRKAANSKPKGILKVDYWGLEGTAPSMPARLSETQVAILTALAAKGALWQFRTNLWELFGLPDSADGLQQFVADH